MNEDYIRLMKRKKLITKDLEIAKKSILIDKSVIEVLERNLADVNEKIHKSMLQGFYKLHRSLL